MKKNKQKSSSFRRNLIVAFIVTILLQCLILYAAIAISGTVSNLRNTAAETLTNRVELRGRSLEGAMARQWSANVGELLLQHEHGAAPGGPSGAFTSSQVNRLLALMRTSMTTGAFIICDNPSGVGEYPALYLRSAEPKRTASSNRDVLAEYGPSPLMKQMGLTLDSNWSTNIKLDPDNPNAEFYFALKDAVKHYPLLDAADLGRWSPALRIPPNDSTSVITYCRPLIGPGREMLGVMGVEVSLQYMAAYLPYDELAPDLRGVYLLGIQTEDGTVTPLLKSGAMFPTLSNAADIRLSGEPKLPGVYALHSDGLDGEVLCARYDLTLYNTNTPFEGERWVLLGLMEKNELLAAPQHLQMTLTIAFPLVFIVSLILAIFVSLRLTAPINQMAQALHGSDPDSPITLPRSRTLEVDELAVAVELLSADVASAASRMSKIFQIMNLPISAVEYDPRTQQVICAGHVGKLLNFSPRQRNQTRFPVDIYQREIDAFAQKCSIYQEGQDPDGTTFSILCDGQNGGPNRYISFRSLWQDEKLLTVVQDVTSQIQEKLTIEHERDYDVLTNLLNRRAFRTRTDALLQAAPQSQSAMVMWDLDNLKYVNDTYGHDFGDKYIRKAASIIGGAARGGGVVSRISGDEFLAFLTGFFTQDDLLTRIRAVQADLLSTELHLPGGQAIRLRASAGVAWCPGDASDYSTLVRYADFAMYSAKHFAKGDLRLFDAEAFRRDELLFSGKEALNSFIEHEQARFAFQPIVDAHTGEVFAYEALMRPQSDILRSVSDVMRLAKAQSQLNQIERITWLGALRDFAAQRDRFGDARLFINSIPSAFLSLEDLRRTERLYGKELSRLVVELIESEETDINQLIVKQQIVHDWGGLVALDDLGSGYNTDSSLLQLDLAFVKVDIAIVHDIDRDPDRQMLLANILRFTRAKGMRVVAEGVERVGELKTLISLGVDLVQGFYLGRPNLEVRDIAPSRAEQIRELWAAHAPGALPSPGEEPPEA